MKSTLIAALSLCAFISTQPVTAAEGGGAGHSHFIEIPETAEEIWKEIANQQTKLSSVVASGDLGEAHDHGYAIRDLVRALPAKVSADNKAKTEEAVKSIAKIAAAIDKSSAGGAKKATEANVTKLTAAINALQASLKAI